MQVIKPETKGEKLKLIPQKYKGFQEITMNKYMPRNWTTWAKWTTFQKHTICKTDSRRRRKLNRPITTREIEAAIKKLPAHKSPGLDGCKGDFTKHLRKN